MSKRNVVFNERMSNNPGSAGQFPSANIMFSDGDYGDGDNTSFDDELTGLEHESSEHQDPQDSLSEPKDKKEEKVEEVKEDEQVEEIDEEELRKNRLRIEPEYEWLLKDLALGNNKRIIDVTQILSQRESEGETSMNKPAETSQTEDVEHKNVDTSVPVQHEDEEDHNDINMLYEKLVNKRAGFGAEDETKTGGFSRVEESSFDEEEESDDSEAEYLDDGEVKLNHFPHSAYHKWSKDLKHQAELNKSQDQTKGTKFSKSFEVSIEDMDNLTHRLDHGIKLKRAPMDATDQDADETTKSTVQQVKSAETSETIANMVKEEQTRVVETLKQELSNMLAKLESDYKQKLEEQQKQSDLRLKTFQDEMKKTLIDQQAQFFQQQQVLISAAETLTKLHQTSNLTQSNQACDEAKIVKKIQSAMRENDDDPTSGDSNSEEIQASSRTTSRASVNTTPGSHLADTNAKYISNLKAKHARHMQDLKDYYEKEMDELRAQVNAYKIKLSEENSSNASSTENAAQAYMKLFQDFEQEKEINKSLSEELAELRTSHDCVLTKLYESADQIKYLSNENGELSKRLSSLETALANSEEKCGNLEASCSRLESQLSDSIKLQDRYGRELQLEKRNLLKRNQEYEELKQSVRQYEQKCDELEVKLDEKLSTVAVLKSQLVQKEADLNRIDYEYQKLKSLNKQNSQQQAPYMTNLIKEASSQESKPQSLQIRNHMKHMSNPNLHHLSVETHLNTKTQTSASNYNLSPNEKSTATRINLPVHHNNNFESDLNKYAKYYDGTSSTSSISPSRQPSGLTSSLLNRLAAGGENNQPVNGDDHTTNTSQHRQEGGQTVNEMYELHVGQPYAQLTTTQRAAVNSNGPVHSLSTTTTSKSLVPPILDDEHFSSNHVTMGTSSSSSPSQQHNIHKFQSLSPSSQITYIQNLQAEFDWLMSQKKEIEAYLTRLSCKKVTMSAVNPCREKVEDELETVEKRLASVKLELRKLRII